MWLSVSKCGTHPGGDTASSDPLTTYSSPLQSHWSSASWQKPARPPWPWGGTGRWRLSPKTCPVSLRCSPAPSDKRGSETDTHTHTHLPVNYSKTQCQQKIHCNLWWEYDAETLQCVFLYYYHNFFLNTLLIIVIKVAILGCSDKQGNKKQTS